MPKQTEMTIQAGLANTWTLTLISKGIPLVDTSTIICLKRSVASLHNPEGRDGMGFSKPFNHQLQIVCCRLTVKVTTGFDTFLIAIFKVSWSQKRMFF